MDATYAISMRVFHISLNVAGDRPPRYDEKTHPLHVGRGPAPRHASCCSERIPLPVVQARLILNRFTGVEGEPELQRGADAFRYSPAPQGGITTETEL